MNKLIILLFFLHPVISKGQNLVPNYSFEDYTECPKDPGDIIKLHRWNTIPDNLASNAISYMNSCSKSKWAGTNNNYGKQEPKTGNGYLKINLAPFNCIDKDGKPITSHQKYLYIKLIEPLKKDHAYCVKLDLSLADESFYAVDHIGILLTPMKPKLHKEKIKDSENYIALRNYNNELNDKQNWMSVSSYYLAQGDESFLTVGNFSSILRFNGDTIINFHNHIETKLHREGSNYYIDNITVEPVDLSCICNQCIVAPVNSVEVKEEVKDTLEIGKHIILRNIYFETDKATLLPGSYKELTKLVTMMYKSPTMKIEIGGHTDDTGTAEYNIKLSRKRAQAVVDYLKMNNISTDRLSYEGYGLSQPIAKNNTPEGRQENRRVEFIVLSK